jgi:hypothetical protein
VARLPPLLAVAFTDSLVGEYRSILLTVLLSNLFLLLLLSFWIKGAYESHFLNMLELWFLLNLCVMATLAFSINDPTSSKMWFTCCIAVFFLSFLVILVYHFHLCLVKKPWYERYMNQIKLKGKRKTSTSNKKGCANNSLKIQTAASHTSVYIDRHASIFNLLSVDGDDDGYQAINNN